MKTIIITISLGIVVRNILRTDVFRILKAQKDLRIVLVMPPNIDPGFTREQAGDNVIIERWRGRVRAGLFRHFILHPLMRNLVYTETSKFFFLYRDRRDRRDKSVYRPIHYLLSLIFVYPMSKLAFLKRFFRWLNDNFFARYDAAYEFLFDKYQPSLIFTTNLFHEPVCMALTRIARRKGILTAGMVKSWDNLDKTLYITLPDIFLVWNEKMRDDLVDIQCVEPEKIVMTGVPQFDIYNDSSNFFSREEYCQQMGIDPRRKIILFGSEAPSFYYDDEFVDILHQLVVEGAIKEDCAIVVRPRPFEFEFKDSLKTNRFERFKDSNVYPEIKVDRLDHYDKRSGGSSEWNPNREDMIHLTNHLYHCDLLVTGPSTLSLDASVFDKPIINVAFDGLKKRSKTASCLKFYRYAHYKQVVDTKGVKLVYSKEELRDAVNRYLENPSLDREKREKLRQRFCHKLDGKAGERIAQCLLDNLNKD
jgi:glycosyltransferase involved in cell wall biosynthesis